MISSATKDIYLNDYKDSNELFIYGVKGIVRLPFGREIIYNIARSSTDILIDASYSSRIECVFAVTDKRIIFIPSRYNPISFNYGDIGISYYDQLFEKIFLLNIGNKKLLSFIEEKLVFRIYSGQDSQINKINFILKEYLCA